MVRFPLLFCLLIITIGSASCSSSDPRTPILFSVQSEEALKKNIADHRASGLIHDLIISSADEMVGMTPLKRTLQGRRLLGVSRTYVKRVLWLSYAYRMTGEKKFLEQAETEMLSAAGFSDWNTSHFLDVAEMTTALFIGYDWLYNELSEEAKRTIATAIIEKGLLPSMEPGPENSWLAKHNNWNQVCNAGLVLGALAVVDIEPNLSLEIIERAKRTIALPQAAYEPDGAYPEGTGYWNYGTIYNTFLIDALQATGLAEDLPTVEGFMRSAGYHVHAAGPGGYFNYSDNRAGVGFSPAEFWFAARLEDPALVRNQHELFARLLDGRVQLEASGSSNRFFPMTLIWASNPDVFDFPSPTATSWVGQGPTPVGLHRGSWNHDAIFFGIKGGTIGDVSHTHMDVGSFVLDADGVRWIMDLGGHNYHALESQGLNIWGRTQDAERWSIFRYNNRSHSTLTINDELVDVDGVNPIVAHSSRDDFKHSVVDMSGAYDGQLGSAVRGMALIDNAYVVLRDEISSTDEHANVRWAVVTHDNIEITGPRNAVVRHDGRHMNVRVLLPENAELKTWSADPGNDYEDKNPGVRLLGLELDLEPDSAAELVVMFIPGSTESDKVLDGTPPESALAELEAWPSDE